VSPDGAVALVRRTRIRLEALRWQRAACRGALLGTGVAFILVLLGKAAGSAVAGAWWFPVAGLVAGSFWALFRRGIDMAGAALLLDARWRTGELFTTVLSRRESPRAAEWAGALDEKRGALSLPWPREAGLLPVALFLLFAATLIPAGGEPAPVIAVPADGGEKSAQKTPSEGDPEAAAERLEEGRALSPDEKRSVEEAIEAAFARPEERARARELLEAAGGDAAARERLGEALLKGAGALGEQSRSGAIDGGGVEVDARLASPYPDHWEYLRAYRVEKARLLREKR